jgi:hypothetical protein
MRVITTLMLVVLSACASSNWTAAYRNCPLSSQAHYYGIPLASRDEHAQAELFRPLDPSNCVVYVVRSDRVGAKSAHAKVFLYRPGMEPPALPANCPSWFGMNCLLDPQWSARHRRETPQELRTAEIFSGDVYAAWEVPSGTYTLDASLSMDQPFARAVVACPSGRTVFWQVSATSFLSSKATLDELDEASGKALVRGRLRSAGMQSGSPLSPNRVAEHACPVEQ